VSFSCISHSAFLIQTHNIPGMVHEKNGASEMMFLYCTVASHINQGWNESNMMFMEHMLAITWLYYLYGCNCTCVTLPCINQVRNVSWVTIFTSFLRVHYGSMCMLGRTIFLFFENCAALSQDVILRNVKLAY